MGSEGQGPRPPDLPHPRRADEGRGTRVRQHAWLLDGSRGGSGKGRRIQGDGLHRAEVVLPPRAGRRPRRPTQQRRDGRGGSRGGRRRLPSDVRRLHGMDCAVRHGDGATAGAGAADVARGARAAGTRRRAPSDTAGRPRAHRHRRARLHTLADEGVARRRGRRLPAERPGLDRRHHRTRQGVCPRVGVRHPRRRTRAFASGCAARRRVAVARHRAVRRVPDPGASIQAVLPPADLHAVRWPRRAARPAGARSRPRRRQDRTTRGAPPLLLRECSWPP